MGGDHGAQPNTSTLRKEGERLNVSGTHESCFAFDHLPHVQRRCQTVEMCSVCSGRGRIFIIPTDWEGLPVMLDGGEERLLLHLLPRISTPVSLSQLGLD